MNPSYSNFNPTDFLIVGDTISLANPPVSSRSVFTTGPLQGGGSLATDLTLTIDKADATTDGYLSSTDWNTFSSKVAGTGGLAYNLTVDSSGPPSTPALTVKGLGIEQMMVNDEGLHLYGSPYTTATAHAALMLIDVYGGTSSADPYYYLDTDYVLNGDGTRLTGVALSATTISTTAPLTGGGDLSTSRTLAISDFVASGASHARGAVPDPGVTGGTAKFLREDATWNKPVLADLGDVALVAPLTNEVLQYNGANWFNAPVTPTVGVSTAFFFQDTAFGTGGLFDLVNNVTGSPEDVDSVTVGASTVASAIIDGYVSDPIGVTTVPGGEWVFDLFVYTTNTAGSSFVVVGIYQRITGAGTVTITGTGTSRTATVTGGTPFVLADANADIKLGGILETPNGSFPITGFSSSSVVTVNTPTGYANEAGVAYAKHKWLFNATTPDIASTSVIEYTISSVQPAFTGFSLTDRISAFTFGYHPGTGNRTISVVHNGTVHYSHFHTPLVQDHNSLAGLQGGTSGEYYHLTSAQYTIATTQADATHTGYLSSTDWGTFNSKVGTARTISTTAPLAGGGDLSANRTLTIADALADGVTKGAATFNATNFSAAAGVVNTIQNINTTASPQFTAVILGTSSIRPAADSTTAIRVLNAANAVVQLTFDTTNRRVSVPTTLLVAASAPTYSAALTVAPSYTTQAMTDHIAGTYMVVTANNAADNPFNTYSFAGLRCAVSKTGAGFAEAVYGTAMQVVTNSSGNVNNAWGGYFVVQAIGTGTIANQTGGYFYRQAAAGGVVTNSYGLYIANMVGTGCTNNYGLYLATQTNGQTLNYAIYSAGGQSYHAGNFGLNTTVPACRLTISSADTGTTEDEIRLANTSAGAASRHGIGWYATNNAKVFTRLSAEFGSGYVTNKFHIEVGDSSGTLQDRFVINSIGNVGIGQTTPTAVVHLKAGSATLSTAPLKFTSGTLLGTPEVGTMEYDNNFYLTLSTGTRYKIPLISGTDYQVPLVQADGTHDGYLTSGDWTAFTNKASALTTDTTFYVRTDGNDSNTGLVNTAGGAFLTIQHAIDVAQTYDLLDHTVVIQVADGTYNGTLEIGSHKARAIHYGTTGWLIIRGNVVTPANVSIVANSSATSGHAICASMQSRVRLESFKVSSTDAGIANLVNAQLSSVVRIDNLVFGSMANASGVHIVAEAVAQVSIVGNYTIANGAYGHIQAMMSSTVWSSGGLTVTLTGTPAFTRFVRAETASAVFLPTMTFVGSATGSKFSAASNGVIDMGGLAVDVLPGSTVGTVETGGQYLGTGNTPPITITTNTTFYVRTDGNDANSGLFNTAAGAWLTIQHAIDFVSGCVIFAGVTATVQVADGTYNEAVVTRKNIGGGSTVLNGNTVTPANCIIQGGASAAISGGSQLPWTVSGFELRSTSSDCVSVSGSLNLGSGIRFGVAGLSHVRARLAGKVQLTASYAIVGAAQSHFTAQTAGTIFVTSGITVTITGTPAFSVAFVSASSESTVQIPSVTFSGSATGVRYLVASSAVIDANGGIFNYLPGDSAGSATTGGQYLGTGVTPVALISTATTYYVDTTNGLDTNDGLAAGAGRALKTIQAAVNLVTSQFVAAGVVVTISIADGTYNEAVTLRPITGGGTITVQGNTATPTNVIVQGGSGTAFTVSGGTVGYTLTGLEIRSTSAQGIGVTGSESALTVGASIVFGTCATNHMRVINNSLISLTSSYTISGAAAVHYSIDRGGRISVTPSITITITGTPAFSTAFVVAATLGSITIKTVTFSGSATGVRYTGTTLALIDTGSGSGTYFPGDSAGSVATSAVYT